MEIGRKKRVGNFVVTKKRDKYGEFILIRSLSREWEIRYGAGSNVFRLINGLANNDNEWDGFKTWLSVIYGVSNVVDGKLTLAVMEDLYKYLQKDEDEAVDDEKILEEEREAHRLMEEAFKETRSNNDPVE